MHDNPLLISLMFCQLNISVRGERERAALGDSLTGIVVLDVELLKVYPQAQISK